MTKRAINYKELRAELDSIISRLQQDTGSDIDDSVKLYERGAFIIDELQNYLKTAENKIKKLSKYNK